MRGPAGKQTPATPDGCIGESDETPVRLFNKEIGLRLAAYVHLWISRIGGILVDPILEPFLSENIKAHAIPFTGYLYQNLQGLRVLCDWLDAPSRYTRVKFECDDEAAAPTSLDDILIERADGRVDLHQIKFTSNPDAHLLRWDWMLEKSRSTGRSRSMLRKWFDAYKALDPALIGEIVLATNRLPDAEIEACLDAGKIALTLVPEHRRSEVIAELGTEKDCEDFLSQLLIHHSDKGSVPIEHEVKARLQRHGTHEGIATLMHTALSWATQKNCPHPDGWITLDLVRSILQSIPPAPLTEDFVVPIGYEVPDEQFHEDFLRDVVGISKSVIVLTGPPGRGKSTYLSALCETLEEQKVPVVRHHYFLSTLDRGRDRVNNYVVEQSITAQVKRFYPEVQTPSSGNLRAFIEACSSHYKEHDKPFVLVLDGLDHVWRINSGDKRPLDDVFSQLIPPPDNLILLVGTQQVDDLQLPTDLLTIAPKAEWRELPAMSENAVLTYVKKTVQEGRLSIDFRGEEETEGQLQEVATALRRKTNGHPLHLIYAVSELEQNGRTLSRWAVEQLRGELSKDAKDYYKSLWLGLPSSLKDTLRLVCAFSFFWPRAAFGEIAARVGTAAPDMSKVEHLLHSSEAGLNVFHESLAVFVRTSEGYDNRVKELLPAVAEWLESAAPTSLRVNWLWSIQARQGDSNNLINGLTRDWLLLRVEEGYPASLFDTLLSDALVAALDTKQFAEAHRLAHLKERMVSNSQFQMPDEDMARLISYTLTLTAEENVVREAEASRHEADILHVASLGLALRSRGEVHLARVCGDEALRRFRGLSRFSTRYSSISGADEFKFFFDAFARLGAIGATTTALARLISNNAPVIWLPRVRMLVEEGELDELMTIAPLLVPGKSKNIISDASLRAAATAGVNIAERDDFNSLARTPFVAAVEVAHTQVSKPLNEPIPIDWLSGDFHERKDNLATLAHHWFFSSVHVSLCMAAEGQSAFSFVRAPKYKDRSNISEFLDALSVLGAQVASYWWQGRFVDFHILYELLDSVEFRRYRQSHEESTAANHFRSALHRIACDIRLGSILQGHTSEVALTEETLEAARQFTWFDDESFRAQYAAGLLTKMSDSAAEAFIHSQRVLLDAEIGQETSERLQKPLQLCAIALAHGFADEARQLCKQTWELTTGYLHRKDRTLNNTVEAIGYLVDVAPDDARRLLGRIAPQIHHILEYTDGKETRHVLADADRLLAKLKPSALVTKYEEHTYDGDWGKAENSMRAYVEQGIKDGWPMASLMRTGLHGEIHDVLKRLAQDGNSTAEERLRVLREHAGWDIGLLQKREYSSGEKASKPSTVDVSVFGPEQFEDLLNRLSNRDNPLDNFSTDYNEKPRLLRTWFEYWDKAGQGRRLLAVLDDMLLSEERRNTDALVLSDLAFHTKRKLSGLKAAWKYLVKAHILNGGWLGFAENEEATCSRLDLVAKHYPHRCDEFVAATTYSMFGAPLPPRIAPSELMVYFYVQQSRILDAVKYAETMVDCVIQDTRTLPLVRPRWAEDLAPHGVEVS